MVVLKVQLALWVLGAVLEVVVAAVILYRKIYREYPVFCAYSLFHLARTAALALLIHRSYSDYFYTYWASEFVDALLGLAVVQEVFTQVFRPYEALRRLGKALFRWSAIVLLALCVLMAASAPASDTNRIISALLVLERTANVLEGGLLFFLFIFCKIFGIALRRYAFGIAAGLGVLASIVSSAAALRAHIGIANNVMYSLVHPIAYNIAVGIWVWYVATPERVADMERVPDTSSLAALNRALMQVLNR